MISKLISKPKFSADAILPHIQKTTQGVGNNTLRFMEKLGALVSFAGQGIFHCFTPPFFPKQLRRQFIDIGYYSLPVVGMTA